ncbi:MAG: hypothetical protein ACREM3_29890 [Candidatus Rokuibacteriota bacterium]
MGYLLSLHGKRLMATRSRMTRRAVIERDVATGSNPYGNAPTPNWQPLAAPVPCYVWSRVRRAVVSNNAPGQPGVVLVEDLRALFPAGADVQEGDQVTNVTDRLGNIVWPGPILIEALQPRPDHVEAQLRRIT